jgi:hypothetical protein
VLRFRVTRKDVINVKCPGCGEVLEIDVLRERVTAHRKGPHLHADRKEGEDILDVAMRNVRTAKDRIQSEFHAAQERLKNQSEHLDKLFREAQKKVREDPPASDEPHPAP